MFARHRLGISFGLVVTVILGGLLGYVIGANDPGIVFGQSNSSAAGSVAAVIFAAFGSLIWLIGEGIVGLAGAVGRDATLLRIGISLMGSFSSTVTSGLTLMGIHPLSSGDAHSIFAFGPIAGGLGAVALGVHALLHQLHLDRLARR